MAITFNCTQCGKSYTLDDSLAGKQAKCSCGTEMTVPAPSAAPAPPAAPSPFAEPVPGQLPPAAPSPFAEPVPGQLPPAAQMPGSPYASPGYAPQGGGKSDKQKIPAALLCWFLGALGVHRFYLGYTGIGVIQLLTLGGCGIWTIIDFIMILTGGLKDAGGKELS
jgi:hypothetical protein